MTDGPIDRRSRPRVGLLGTATIMRAGSHESAELTIRDLSSGGARLVGRLQLVEGERIPVTLALEGVSFSIVAEVVRTEPQNAQVAIAFRDLPPDALETIERAVARMIESVRASSPPTVLIVGAEAGTRAALERDLAQLGARHGRARRCSRRCGRCTIRRRATRPS